MPIFWLFWRNKWKDKSLFRNPKNSLWNTSSLWCVFLSDDEKGQSKLLLETLLKIAKNQPQSRNLRAHLKKNSPNKSPKPPNTLLRKKIFLHHLSGENQRFTGISESNCKSSVSRRISPRSSEVLPLDMSTKLWRLKFCFSA